MNVKLEQHYRDLALNLIETLGPQRGLHVAKQFSWYGVADEIVRLNRDVKTAH